LEGGPPGFAPGFSCRALLRISATGRPSPSRYRALTVSGAPFQGTSADFTPRVRGSYNPEAIEAPVWARPVSLAATPGISVDSSSSGY
jgi:hypothetical protein